MIGIGWMGMVVLLITVVLAVPLFWAVRPSGDGAVGRSSVFVAAFGAFAVLGFSAVFMDGPYRVSADALLVATGVRERIRAMDDAFIVDDLITDTRDVARGLEERIERERRGAVERLRSLLGRPTSTPPEPTESAQLPAPDGGELVDETGIFERGLYPTLQALVGGVLRAGAVVLALCGMAVTSAMAVATTSIRRVGLQRRRWDDIERRLQRIENAVLGAAERPAPGSQPGGDVTIDPKHGPGGASNGPTDAPDDAG